MTKNQAKKIIKARIKERYDTHEKASAKLGISRSYVSMIANNPDIAPDRILKKLGVKRITHIYYQVLGTENHKWR